MGKAERIIDLRSEEEFVEEYVSLRNHYKELLLSKSVEVAETKEWLKGKQIEIRVLVQDKLVLGTVILYLDRDGEIAIFVRDPRRRIGTKLLKIIENVAKEKKLKSVWAWVLVDNENARRLFEKNGYEVESRSLRVHEGEEKSGVVLRKRIA